MATLECPRCGWTMDTREIDIQGIPGPDRCTQVFNGPNFPADQGDPNHHISGSCNGKLIRKSA